MNAPSDSKIGELSAKLQELDLGTYLRIEAYDIFQDDDPRRQWMIQGVIQDAVMALPDYYAGVSLTFTPYFEEKKWGAEIYAESAYIDLLGEGNTPAEALLAAYVAALEAEAKK